MRGAVDTRFWAKVDRTGNCWLWVGKRTARGYGLFHPPDATGEFVLWCLKARGADSASRGTRRATLCRLLLRGRAVRINPELEMSRAEMLAANAAWMQWNAALAHVMSEGHRKAFFAGWHACHAAEPDHPEEEAEPEHDPEAAA